jgi:MFS family permease
LPPCGQKLAAKNIDISSPAKFALGLFFAGLGFLVMIFPANTLVTTGGLVKVSAMWLIVSYLFQTFGELLVSPVGLSSMTKLSPRRFVGQMMGIWFLAASVGNLIAGLVEAMSIRKNSSKLRSSLHGPRSPVRVCGCVGIAVNTDCSNDAKRRGRSGAKHLRREWLVRQKGVGTRPTPFLFDAGSAFRLPFEVQSAMIFASSEECICGRRDRTNEGA